MSTAPHTRHASWDDYLALGEDSRAEYIDGQIVMSPLPSLPHQDVCFRLMQLLLSAIPPTHRVTTGWGWKPNANEFGPDVMVFPRTEDTVRYTGIPALVVEVLSSNRSDDLVWKFNRYAQAGLPHYWIVDLRDRELLAYRLLDGSFTLQTQIDSNQPHDLSFGVGTVRIDLAELLAPL